MAKKGMQIAEALQHLRLDKSAGEEDVKLAYRELAKMWHPDRYRNDDPMKPEADRMIKVVNEAKSVALTYVKKYGHFRHVRDPGVEPRRKAPPRQPPKPPPSQGAPPRPKPKQEPKKQNYQAPPRQAPPKQKAPPRGKATGSKAKPGPKPHPKSKTEPKVDFNSVYDDTSFADYLPSQSTMIGVIILAAVVFFMYTMISSLFDSPADRLKAYTQQAAMEERIVRPAKKKVDVEEIMDSLTVLAEEEEVEAEVDTFFTLGSTKEWVSYVQGSPLQIKGPVWRYGFSTITFEGDSVIAWVNSELNPMKVGIILEPEFSYPYSTYDVGSTIQEVVYLQGPPDVVVDTLWSYGEATVTFNKQGQVVTWKDDMQNRLFVQ